MAARLLMLVSAVAAMNLVVAGPVYGFDVPRLSFITTATLAAFVLVLPQVGARLRQSSIVQRALAFAAVAFPLWVLALTVSGEVPMLSLIGQQSRFVGGLALGVPALLVLILPVVLSTARDFDRALAALSVLVGLGGFYAVVQFAGLDPMPWAVQAGGRPVSFFGNSNFVGAALCIGAPLAWWAWTGGRRWRAYGVGLLVIVAVAIYLAQVRLGMIAAATGLAVAVSLSFRWPTEALREWALRLIPIASVVAGSAAVVVGAAIGDVNGQARVRFWEVSWRLIRESPVLGHGIGRFEPAYRAARLPQQVIDENGLEDQAVDSSHNFVIDIAATGGLPTALLWLTVLVLTGWLLARMSGAATSSAGHRRVVVLAGLLAAHGVQSAISVPIITTVWTGWLLVALVLTASLLDADGSGSGRRKVAAGRGRRRTRRQTPAMVAASVSAVAVAGLVAFSAGSFFQSTADVGRSISVRAADPFAAMEFATTAAERTPWWPEAWHRLAEAQETLGDDEGVRTASSAAIDADPRDRQGRQLLLGVAGRSGDADEIWSIFSELQQLDPNGVDLHMNMLRAALVIGDPVRQLQAQEVIEAALPESGRMQDRYQAILQGG